MAAKMRNAGQACTAANRFLVESPIEREFAEALAARMSALVMGPGSSDGVDVGPLIDSRQLRRVESLVAQAVASGAEVLTGGRRVSRPGYFFEPTVLRDLLADAALLRQEIFGPVAPIVTFDGDDEAVAIANDTDLGLAAYVQSGDLARALRLARRLEYGMVGVNKGSVSEPSAPFGGVKLSGLGREGGRSGLLEYQETKYLAVEGAT